MIRRASGTITVSERGEVGKGGDRGVRGDTDGGIVEETGQFVVFFVCRMFLLENRYSKN